MKNKEKNNPQVNKKQEMDQDVPYSLILTYERIVRKVKEDRKCDIQIISDSDIVNIRSIEELKPWILTKNTIFTDISVNGKEMMRIGESWHFCRRKKEEDKTTMKNTTTATNNAITADEFIRVYKEYELALRNILGKSPYEYESEIEDSGIQSMLQIIRLNRNFIQHQKESDFVQISQKQVELLQKLTEQVKRTAGTVKDAMVPIRKCRILYDDFTVSEALSVFAETETKRIPVICRQNGQFLGMCTVHQFLKYMNQTRNSTKLVPKRKGTCNLELEDAPEIEADSMVYDLKGTKESIYIVVKKQKVVGLLLLDGNEAKAS